MRRDVKQGAQISLEVPPGDFGMFPEPMSRVLRLHGLIQVMHRGLNLADLHLNDLLTRIRESKDLNRYADLLQRKDLVQDKGL
jgi:hypothetical protein